MNIIYYKQIISKSKQVNGGIWYEDQSEMSSYTQAYTYLTTINVIQHKVQLVWSLEGIMKTHQKRMTDIFKQHISLRHNVFHLISSHNLRFL